MALFGRDGGDGMDQKLTKVSKKHIQREYPFVDGRSGLKREDHEV